MRIRSLKIRLLVVGIVAILTLLQRVDFSFAQTVTIDPTDDEMSYGRLLEEADLLTGPRGTVIGTYSQGNEFTIITDLDTAGYEVTMLLDGETGWLETDQIELAMVGSTGTYREYPSGGCTATPTVARRLPSARFYHAYQHELRFADEVVISDIEDFYLIFNQKVWEIAYRIDERANALVLPAGWILAHSGFAPRWDVEGAWRVEWDCSENGLLDDLSTDG